jgi:hypothetical protein
MIEQYTTHSKEENEKLKMDELMARHGQTMLEPGKNLNFNIKKFDRPEEGSELFYTGLEMLQEFVNLPIITDEMPHAERRTFRHELKTTDPAYHEFLENNKIRWNHVGNMQPVLEVVHDYVKNADLPEDIKRKIETLADSCPTLDATSYAALSTEQKIAHAKRIEKIIIDILTLLTSHEAQDPLRVNE